MSQTQRQQRQITFSAVASVCILLLIVATCSIYLSARVSTFRSQGQGAKDNQKDGVENVTICQLAADPAKYNQKVVKITAFLTHGFEDSAIFDPGCDSRFGIWYEYGGKNVTGTMYCCGLTNARTRPEQIRVENISIPLVVDEHFQKLDQLIHQKGDTVVRATVIGRFFSGEKGTAANGRDWWSGYGHLGCCSLFMIQQVVQVDSHDRTDVDYRSSADQPNTDCGYQILRDESRPSQVEIQKDADSGASAWMFDDPGRVAFETFTKFARTKPSSSNQLHLTRQAQGRLIYEWKPKTERAVYMVVISRPYELSFYSKTGRVAWMPIGAYRSSCNPNDDFDVGALTKP